MIPLTMAAAGSQVSVLKISVREKEQELKKHLEDLGFVVGAIITVISSHEGDVIVNIKDSRLAITKEMADRIKVQPV